MNTHGMHHGEDTAEFREALTDLIGDFRAWVEWAGLTGGQDWPVAEAGPLEPVAARSTSFSPPTPPRTPVAPTRAQAQPPVPVPAAGAIAQVLQRSRPPTGRALDAATRTAAREALEIARAEIVPACQRCPLSEGRRHVVFGGGRVGAQLFVVGDQPGPEDDMTGEAWSGRVGRLLTRMLKAIGFEREDVFVTHLVKCHGAASRDPTRREIETCHPYLLRQVQAVGPRAILSIGNLATQVLLGSDAPPGSLRGRVHDFSGVPLVVSHDPAYLIAAPRMKAHTWDDLRLLRSIPGISSSR